LTDKDREDLAREEARQLVKKLRISNLDAARNGAPQVDEHIYRELEHVMTRKLLRKAA
jgi:hypothetical protein